MVILHQRRLIVINSIHISSPVSRLFKVLSLHMRIDRGVEARNAVELNPKAMETRGWDSRPWEVDQTLATSNMAACRSMEEVSQDMISTYTKTADDKVGNDHLRPTQHVI
jgi:hypothetical protein